MVPRLHVVKSQYTGGNASSPYGMMISRILKDIGVDLSSYSVKKISSTYENLTFTSMGDAMKTSMKHLIKETLKFKVALSVVVDELHKIQDSLAQVLLVTRDSGEEIAKLKSQINHLQREGIKSFNQILKQVNFVVARAKSPTTRPTQQDAANELSKKEANQSTPKEGPTQQHATNQSSNKETNQSTPNEGKPT
ncbi:hypothetical protein HAX54_024601 [Datura stramonium]|uniref:Uncharacterized protein n=1 Tax=Datura stramonium TaxID=4076 RepID=A0ABS8UZ43_DATST|nr:hypothetical protein [Datura stramonium]